MGSRDGMDAFGVVLCFIGLICYAVYTYTRRISTVIEARDYAIGRQLSGIVDKVPDGDGFDFIHTPPFRTTVCRRDHILKVRLAGIDAPEMGGKYSEQQFARKAKDHLRALILHKQISIKVMGIDCYGRILAFAYVPDILWFTINVNIHMVANGLACVYDRRGAEYGEYRYDLNRAQSSAKIKNLGMWSQPNTITPMEYKRLFRTIDGVLQNVSTNSSNTIPRISPQMESSSPFPLRFGNQPYNSHPTPLQQPASSVSRLRGRMDFDGLSF